MREEQTKLRSSFGLKALVAGFLIGLGSPCVGGVVPDMHFYVSVETNDWMNRPRGKNGLNVSVNFQSSDDGEGERMPSVEVNCYEFPSDCRRLGERELEVFHQVCEEAGERRAKEVRVTSQGFMGEVETIFESKKQNGNWVARITRRGKSAILDPTESGRVKAAMAEAEAGATWFKLLRTADKLPEKTADAHPPKSNGIYLDSTVGEVDGGGMDYEVSLDASSFNGRKVDYTTGNTFKTKRGTTGGEWVYEAFGKISEAAEVAKAGKKFAYESGKVGTNGDTSYTITANAKTGKADVTLSPGPFFKSEKIWKGSFGPEEVEKIRKLQDEAKTRQKWFEEHEGIFFSRSRPAGK